MRCFARSDLLPGLPRGLPLAAITVSPRTLDLEFATILIRLSVSAISAVHHVRE